MIYAHFDGQPVDAANWCNLLWQPTLRAGALDDGADVVDWDNTVQFDVPTGVSMRARQVTTRRRSLRCWQHWPGWDAAGMAPSVNIKLILDGEEEAGLRHWRQSSPEHGATLATDLLLFCDGPMHQSRMRQLVFGVRGSMTVDLTTYGAIRPLHSGHYGNWSPNPTDALIHLLAAMKDDEGNITVPGYMDEVRPISSAERAAIAAMPRIDDVLREDLALGRVEGAASASRNWCFSRGLSSRVSRPAASGRNRVMSSSRARPRH